MHIITASPKIGENLLDRSISLEEAKIAMDFGTEEGRKQIIEDIKTIDDVKKLIGEKKNEEDTDVAICCYSV